AAAGHGVYAGPRKRALAHVEGRDAHLHLVDGIERNRLGVGLAPDGTRKAKRVVENSPVDGDVVVEVVAARKATAYAGLR
nr:hypothetical protein [Tanacetum cinerariifolium]